MENFILGNPSRSSNPGPSAPLGPAPAPRAPRGLPPLSALPLTPAPPGSLCSGSVAGTGDLTRHRSAREAHLIARRESKSSTSAAPVPPAASPWRRAAASRRTARRSLAACLRSGTTFCRRASTWPCARSWGAIQGGVSRNGTASRNGTIAARRLRSLWRRLRTHFGSLVVYTAFKFPQEQVFATHVRLRALKRAADTPLTPFCKPSRSSNPEPSAPLGPAPAPRAPRGLPPLSALPLTPAPPGSLCSVSVNGTGNVATRRGTAAPRVSPACAMIDTPSNGRAPFSRVARKREHFLPEATRENGSTKKRMKAT